MTGFGSSLHEAAKGRKLEGEWAEEASSSFGFFLAWVKRDLAKTNIFIGFAQKLKVMLIVLFYGGAAVSSFINSFLCQIAKTLTTLLEKEKLTTIG